MTNTYIKWNKEDKTEERIKVTHPAIGEYTIRVTKVLSRERATHWSNWLNKMMRNRGGRHNLFRVFNYGTSNTKFAVLRKALPNDLVEALERKCEKYYHSD